MIKVCLCTVTADMVVALSEPDGCCVPESEMLVIRDLNMAAPYKGGNQYARICPECGSRMFTTKAYFESVGDPYVIPNGDDSPVRLFDCPFEECGGTIYEGEEACDDCDGEVDWVDEDEEETVEEEAETEEATA